MTRRAAITTPNWFPDEIVHAGPAHLDPAYVETYDRKAGTDPMEDVALLRARGLNESSILVDFGAGSGTLALAVAPLCREVIAVDVSRAMLDRLREKAARSGIDNIICVQSGFLSYAHAGDPVDFVYSRNALHHLPDFWKAIALERIGTILTPGGLLRLHDLVYSFEPREAEAVFEPWLAAAPDDRAHGWTRAELETHIREEHSTFSWLLEPMLARAGFTIDEASYMTPGIFAAYSCIKIG